jgi:hypothetical protein
MVDRQGQTGGQSQAGQSDGFEDVDRVGDMRQRQPQTVRGRRRVRGVRFG